MQLLNGFVLLNAYLITMFIIVHTKKDISIGNFTWGGGCLLITLYTFFIFGTHHLRQIIITALITLWCLRLAYYVWLRYKKGADPRYVAWLSKWNNPLVAFLFSFSWVVILNGLFSLVMAAPSLVINITKNQPSLNILDWIAICIWIVGFLFETISDYQMYLFKQNPANNNKILDMGLWRYSRHPNYFGEIIMWWGIYLLALSVPYGWLTIIAPSTITILLLFITGIPWAERAIEKLPGYDNYKKNTSILLPWFAKN